MNAKSSTVRLTQLALLSAIEILLTFTPLGFIPLPTISITTLHVPVIIGAILLGPVDGAILGGVMGLCSVFKSTFQPTSVTSYLISPFTSGNPLGSLIMTVGARIMIGVVAGYLYQFLKKRDVPTVISIGISAFFGTITNTILFLGCMSLFFSTFPLTNILSVVIGVNSIAEILVAIIISIAVCLPVMKYLHEKIIVSSKMK